MEVRSTAVAIVALAALCFVSCGSTNRGAGAPCDADTDCGETEYCGFRDVCGYEVGVCVVDQLPGHCCTQGNECRSGECNVRTRTCS